jgi:hypothetical protein
MGLSFTTDILDQWMQDIIDLIDADGASGLVRFYDGVRPASGAAITTETLLAEVVLDFPCGAVGTGGDVGKLLFVVPASVNAAASGDATWARIVSAADVHVVDGDVGPGLEFDVNTNTFTAGQPVTFTSMVFDALQNG